jgi:hypothetical protein
MRIVHVAFAAWPKAPKRDQRPSSTVSSTEIGKERSISACCGR